jgi:hypothetical protein
MSTYSCEICGKYFSQKSHYDSHKRRKNPCENYSNKIKLMVDKKVKDIINDLNLKKLIVKNKEIINQTYNNMNTFIDLYKFLQLYEENNILKWLEEPWVGKDKQESLLRLFAGLGLIYKIKSYDICKGNYNEKTITKNTTIKDVFYNQEDKFINLKDKGDSSDLTGICKKNGKHLLVSTSKNLNKTQVGKLDIDKILTNFKQYQDEEYTMSLCICIRDGIDFETMKKNVEKTNHQLKSLLEKEDTIIIDWNDLNQAYHQFKIFYGETPIDNIIKSNKATLCLKMHQHLGVFKTIRMKNCEKKKILWGHIQRSGKSYIIGGCIIEDSKGKDECNYLVITTAPNETIEQQRKVFDCIQLTDFNIIVLNGKNIKPDLTKKNIIICSKQFLQTKIDKGHDKYKHSEEKTKSIVWLKKISFDMRFIDESHNGGTTELAKKTLEFYGKQAFTVQITATYSKPINDYNIPRDCWILWDLEDIKLCKNITNEGSIIRLVQKHGDCIQNIISKYSQDSIISEYSKYPELWLLTDEIKSNILSKIIKDTQDNNYGWSPDACFLLKQGVKNDKETNKSKIVIKEEFQNEEENLKLWYRVFGKKNKFGIPDKDYPDDIVFMKRIEKICKDPTIDSRFIGEGDFHNEPMIIMAFLPQNNIDNISKATIKLLERNNVIPDYEIISINSKTTNNPKQSIEDARIKARNSGKKGVMVLSGKQCSLGVSIDSCDIVLLLNNSMGFDMIYQMMFRCMTEGKNKKCGFVVDLNIHRVIETSIINYASLIKPDIHPRDAIKFILQERLINLNGDHWMPSFGNNVSKITALCENVYESYSSNTEKALNHLLNRLRFKEILLTKEEQKIFNAMFSNTTPTKIQKELIDKLLEEDEEKEKIKKGIEKTKVDNEVDNEEIDTSSETSNEDEKKEKQINYMDILKHISPLICLLTIHDKETSFVEMFELIEKNEYVYNILIDQTKSWWGKSIDSKIIKKFINIYIKYMKDDKETNQIIRTVKELFMKNVKNNRELSILIDKYLIPQELEKKSNAEVPTPFKLREEMLDKIPIEFWTSIKKVFEPCAGKGGFIIDIIHRFMNGLEETIPDEKERYKTIVEECLYFSDINPTNIFICKLLIDPYNEYKLNYNEGNTLELDIKEKWDIDGFDSVIGNPPYQNSNNNKGCGNTLWNLFVEKSLNAWLIEKGLLLYVHPRGWRQINSKVGNLMKEKQIIYLNMNSVSKGLEIFKCATDYDYYLIENIYAYKKTYIDDYENKKYEYMINNDLKFIPNHNLNEVFSLVDIVDDNGFINDQSSYEPRKKWMSKNQSNEYKYPCVYSINSKNVISKKWSSRNDKGHFNITKFIFSNGNGYYKDINGDYGLTQWAYAIKCKKEDMDNVEKAFNSNKFNSIIDAINLTSNKYNYNVMKLFKKDFWKEFI